MKISLAIPFAKYQAAGNDFIVIDLFAALEPFDQSPGAQSLRGNEFRAVEKQLLLPIYAFAEHAKQQQQIKEGIRAELFGALVWGAFMGVINAARKNFVALDKKTFDQAEECMWQAIRR